MSLYTSSLEYMTHGTIVRREGEIICKASQKNRALREGPDLWAFWMLP